MIKIKLRSLNELVIRFIRKVENPASNIDLVYDPAEAKEIPDFKRGLQIAKVKNNPGGQITLYAVTFGSTEQFIGGIH